MARFPNFYILWKSEDLVYKGAICFEQVQRFNLNSSGLGAL